MSLTPSEVSTTSNDAVSESTDRSRAERGPGRRPGLRQQSPLHSAAKQTAASTTRPQQSAALVRSSHTGGRGISGNQQSAPEWPVAGRLPRAAPGGSGSRGTCGVARRAPEAAAKVPAPQLQIDVPQQLSPRRQQRTGSPLSWGCSKSAAPLERCRQISQGNRPGGRPREPDRPSRLPLLVAQGLNRIQPRGGPGRINAKRHSDAHGNAKGDRQTGRHRFRAHLGKHPAKFRRGPLAFKDEADP